jgi:hypothetical protein
LGIFGVALLGLLVVGLLPPATAAIRHLRWGPSSRHALGIGALVVSTGIVLLIGSPLTSVPHGTIWWILFGGLMRLWMLDEEGART